MIPDEGWVRTRWWRVEGPQGELWSETSNEQEARRDMRPGDTLYRLWRREELEWRPAP